MAYCRGVSLHTGLLPPVSPVDPIMRWVFRWKSFLPLKGFLEMTFHFHRHGATDDIWYDSTLKLIASMGASLSKCFFVRFQILGNDLIRSSKRSPLRVLPAPSSLYKCLFLLTRSITLQIRLVISSHVSILQSFITQDIYYRLLLLRGCCDESLFVT